MVWHGLTCTFSTMSHVLYINVSVPESLCPAEPQRPRRSSPPRPSRIPINGDTPNSPNGWFGGTFILGNLHMLRWLLIEHGFIIFYISIDSFPMGKPKVPECSQPTNIFKLFQIRTPRFKPRVVHMIESFVHTGNLGLKSAAQLSMLPARISIALSGIAQAVTQLRDSVTQNFPSTWESHLRPANPYQWLVHWACTATETQNLWKALGHPGICRPRFGEGQGNPRNFQIWTGIPFPALAVLQAVQEWCTSRNNPSQRYGPLSRMLTISRHKLDAWVPRKGI